MTIDETVLYFRKKFSDYQIRDIYDVDEKGEDFCEIIISNEKNPTMPMTVCVNDNGCTLSVGRMENITGERPASPEKISAAIEDVVNDKILFVFGYRDEEAKDHGSPFFSRFFALTGREDDMSREYEELLSKLNRPLSGFARKFTSLKGVFHICNFNGTTELVINR